MLDQLKLHHKLVHLIYNHANVRELYQDYEHNHVKMDNVEKLINLKKYLQKNELVFYVYFVGRILLYCIHVNHYNLHNRNQ